MKGRFSRIYLYVAVAALALWGLLAGWVVPNLIRQAYRGESIAFLNDMLAGRSVHSVEFYLGAWRSLALVATGLLVALVAGVYVGVRFTGARRKVIAWVVGGDPALGPRQLLWYAALWGSFGGLAEATFRGVREMITHEAAEGFFRELFWMAPVSAGLGAVVLAVVLVGLAKAGGTNVGLWKASVLFGFLAIYGVVQSRGIPFYPAAEVILSLGLASVVARIAVAHAGTLERLLRGMRPWLVGTYGALTAFAVFSLPSVAELRARAGRAGAQGDLPNILLIILDTVRAPNLGLYGYDRPTTPRIDEWAASGAVFDMALSTAPWTLPAHATLFTGRYNFELNTGATRPLGDGVPTLAEVLADHGYATAGFVANLAFTTETSGLQRGFDRYEDFPITLGRIAESSWWSRTVFRPLRSLGLHSNPKDAAEVTREFLHWADETRDRPFFAFLNYFDAHEPYHLNPFSTTFGPSANEAWAQLTTRWKASGGDRPFSEPMERWVNQYDGGLAYMDQQIGIIFDTLRARGEMDQTLIIVASDHGENFGEHGLLSHRNSLYLTELHVPLVMSLPGEVPSNVRVGDAVTLRDVPATVLDLVGLGDGSAIPGASLAKLWTPVAAGRTASPILAELDLEAGNDFAPAPVSRGDMKTLFEGNLHYVVNGDGVEELYDIREDPQELDNLATVPEFTPALDRLRGRLDSIASKGTNR